MGYFLGFGRVESFLLFSVVSFKYVNFYMISGEFWGRFVLGLFLNGSVIWRERNIDFKNYFLEKVRN